MRNFFIGLLVVLGLTGAIVGLWQLRKPTPVPSPQPRASQQVTVASPSAIAAAKPQVGDPLPFQATLPQGFVVGVFAKGLGKPRDIVFAEDGTLLVSIPEKGTVVALPDKNNDGKADEVKTVISGLDKPHGLAYHNSILYIAEETRVVEYNYYEDRYVAEKYRELFRLPKGGRHTTRTLTIGGQNSDSLYISVGSSCDTCFEKDNRHGSVLVSKSENAIFGEPKIFSKGLRNAVFTAINPRTGELWATEMGRDYLGDTLPPDEINILKDGQDYGWPVCYGKKIYDKTYGQRSQDYCNQTQPSTFDIPAHSAPLGLTFITSPQFPAEWQGDLLVAYHGSWNSSRQVPSKIVRMNIAGNAITGAEDFITGFTVNAELLGRPVDLEFDKAGSLYISDDKTGNIYKVVRK